MSEKTSEVVVVIGAGLIGQAIARRVGSGRHVVLADLDPGHAQRTVEDFMDAGFDASAARVDISSRRSVTELADTAGARGEVKALIHAAGVSASQTSPEQVLRVDLYGTAVVLEVFGTVVAPGGAAVVISSQSGHRLPALTPDEDRLLATTPAEELLDLPLLALDRITDGLHAYQLSKRANALRVAAEAVRWGERGARVNAISPGIVMTPLARDELNGQRGAGYRRMLDLSPAGRAGTPDEIAAIGELLLGRQGAFITGSDILADGGSTASFFYGPLGSEAPTPGR
ncbi:SDR family oxidoreductase [uncultured Propionibacterium sp.]|uniref:SDR family oxidoreductase n=1 Tax=uncultured Propionibacterium sp. TaxID=218066 RepID=UPI00292F7389|nr:SDR family oxidoreductase [uncultured Propionibacterium sp.]